MKKRVLLGFGIFVIVFASLFVCYDGASAGESVLAEDVVILTITDGNQDRIAVYHKASRSLLLYGNPSAKSFGLQLLQIRKMNNDFSLAGKIMNLDYSTEGYSSEKVKELLDKLQKKR